MNHVTVLLPFSEATLLLCRSSIDKQRQASDWLLSRNDLRRGAGRCYRKPFSLSFSH